MMRHQNTCWHLRQGNAAVHDQDPVRADRTWSSWWCGGLTFRDAPRIGANLPTPWIGVWERINLGVFLLWVVMLAVALWRVDNTAASNSHHGALAA